MSEFTIALVLLVGVAVLVVAVLAIRRDIKRKKMAEKWAQIGAKIREELAAWQEKVAGAKHFLTGSWREPQGKQEFVEAVYGGVPDYLWYATGARVASQEELETIIKLFWDSNPSFGDLEVHASSNPEVGKALRIRNPARFAVEVMVGGQACPLYQTGCSMLGGPEKGVVSFIGLYSFTSPSRG